MSDKKKYPRADAIRVAKEICDALKGKVEALIVAGSLRRRKELVGDVEIIFIPKIEDVVNREDLFGSFIESDLARNAIDDLLSRGILSKRLNERGSEMWGEKNKLATHVATGMPVDLFRATADNWFNYLVCRTGSSENNVRICTAAQRGGLKWNPYGSGFTRLSDGQEIKVSSERDVFRIAGLEYLEPHQR